jgi:hypothetical protein
LFPQKKIISIFEKKNMNFKSFSLAFSSVALLLVFSSCNVEPIDPVLADQLAQNNSSNNNGGGSNGGNTSIAGTYLLTAFNTSVPTDLNGDGTASINQMSETTCFNNSTFILNSNNTFTATGGGIDIDLSVTPNVLTCFTDPSTNGTWTLNGNQLTTSYMEGGVSYTDIFTVVGNTLIITEQNGEVVGMANGNPVFLTSDITAIYSKQ